MKSGEYKYAYDVKHYSMIMTNVAFLHHKYLELFTNTVPKSIIDYIVETQNGEDITMNVVIGKYLTELGHPMCVGVYVTSGKKDIGNLSSELIIACTCSSAASASFFGDGKLLLLSYIIY